MFTRIFAVCGIVVIATAMTVATSDGVTMTTRAIDKLDDNRFFTRVGGTLVGITDYAGLVPEQAYTLSSRLVDRDTGELVGDPVFETFMPTAPAGTETIEFEIEPNRTESNIYLALVQVLYDGEVTAQDASTATVIASQENVDNVDQTIEVHAIQAISVSAVDAADGDRSLPPAGGTILTTVNYVNLVAGYSYTVGGQLLTSSGQGTGIFANVPLFEPADKDGALTLEFTVPPGFEGQRLVPSVGLFHQNRVTINADGGIDWIPDSPQPVMIASDPSLGDPAKTISIGTPFDAAPVTAPAGSDTTSTDIASDASSEGAQPPANDNVDRGDDSSGGVVLFVAGLALGVAAALGATWLTRRRTSGPSIG